tara:strand:- start:7670 stop:8458 length:789 start_codon:yes stop_codon:yes gene_type:complete
MLAGISKYLKYIYKTKSVWWYTASAKTRARYIRTLLGSLWLGISNLLFVGVLGFVYGVVFKAENFKDYYIYLGLGFSIWNTIGGSINAAPNIFTNNSASLMNTNINPLFFVLEEWCFEIQSFLQSLGMVIIFLGILDSQIFINLIYTPMHFINLIIFIFWAPLIICLLAARYTDIYQLVPIVTQLIFLMSPILYPERNLGKLSFLANFNPIYKILALFRDSIIEGKFFFKESFSLLFLNIFMFFISLIILNKYKKRLVFYFS